MKKTITKISLLALVAILTNAAMASDNGNNKDLSNHDDQKATSSIFDRVRAEEKQCSANVIVPAVKLSRQQQANLINMTQTAFIKLLEKEPAALLTTISSIKDEVAQKGERITPGEEVLANVMLLSQELGETVSQIKNNQTEGFNDRVQRLATLIQIVKNEASNLANSDFDGEKYWDELNIAGLRADNIFIGIKHVQDNRIPGFNFSELNHVLKSIKRCRERYRYEIKDISLDDISNTIEWLSLLSDAIERNNPYSLLRDYAKSDICSSEAVLSDLFRSNKDENIKAIFEFCTDFYKAINMPAVSDALNSTLIAAMTGGYNELLEEEQTAAEEEFSESDIPEKV